MNKYKVILKYGEIVTYTPEVESPLLDVKNKKI